MSAEAEIENSTERHNENHNADKNSTVTDATSGCAAGCRIVPAELKPIRAREDKSKALRVCRAKVPRSQPLPPNTDAAPLCDCEEKADMYFSSPAIYSKELKHNSSSTGEVDEYRALIEVLKTKTVKEFDRMVFPVLGYSDKSAAEKDAPLESFVRQNIQVSAVDNQVRLVNPLVAQALAPPGIDSHQIQVFEWDATKNNLVKINPFINPLPKPPPLDSADEIAEMAELSWMAPARDVLFTKYDRQAAKADSIIKRAIDKLNRFDYFQEFYEAGTSVNAKNLFRGRLPDDLIGPRLSQFLVCPFTAEHLNLMGNSLTK